MPKEIEFQSEIIKAAKLQGGYGRKWSSQFQVGVVDLVLCLPKAGFIVMEVKKVKPIGKAPFDRILVTTPKQKAELANWERAGAIAVIGVVIDRGSRDRELLLLPPLTERVHSGQWGGSHARGSMPYGGHVDLEALVAAYKASLAAEPRADYGLVDGVDHTGATT